MTTWTNNLDNKECLKNRLCQKGIIFKNEAMADKKAKLDNLLSESLHVTSATDDDKQI